MHRWAAFAALTGLLANILILTGGPAGAAVTLDTELQDFLDAHGFIELWYEQALVEPELALIALDDHPTQNRQAFVARIAELQDTRAAVDVARITLDGQQTDLTLVIAATNERQGVLVTTQKVRSVTKEVRADTQVVRDDTQAHHDRVTEGLRAAAVERYVVGGESQLDTDVASFNERVSKETSVEVAVEDLLDRKRGLVDDLAGLDTRLTDLDSQIAALDDDILAIQTRLFELATAQHILEDLIAESYRLIQSLDQRIVDLELEIPSLIPLMHEERMSGQVRDLGLPLVTIDAYVRGARLAGELDASCGIRWPTLAGIAAVESGHGTYRGAAVGTNGVVLPRILGVVLNGSLADTAVIGDTDGGSLDGNDEFDRAVGPFQFIPSTWKRWGHDATSDGQADPHNLYDGALSAGLYMCATSPMATDEQARRGIFSYNHSDEYVAAVMARAKAFRAYALPPAPNLQSV